MTSALPGADTAAPRMLNVAIVDDDESVRRELGKLMRGAGINASCYASAEQFLAYAEQRLVDCLVLDVHLGGMSGFDLHRHLQMCGMAPPVIFITARDTPGMRTQARLVGCASYFAKPVPGRPLTDAVVKAVRGAGRNAATPCG